MIIGEFHYLTDRQSRLLLAEIGTKNRKYRLITLLMLDAGLRVSEALSLKLGSFRFREKVIRVKSLKKRTEQYRDVPMSARLMECLAYYISRNFNDKNKDEEAWLLPSRDDHLKRRAVWAYYDRIRKRVPELRHLHPHALRHTFATRLISSDVSLLTAKELLGHSTIQTTEIYTHVPSEVLKSSIQKIEQKHSFWAKLKYKLIGKAPVPVIRLGNKNSSILVGREKELLQIEELSKKSVNILLKGGQGVGKSQILENIRVKDRKVVRMDEMKNVKTSLLNFASHVLNEDKAELKSMLFPNGEELEKNLTKQSTRNLVELLKRITTENEYTVIIDDLTDITPTGVKVLEMMRNHFHIIASARFVKLDKSSFLTNFQTVDIKNMNRPEALELVQRLSYDVISSIEDYELYKNHIWEQTQGNPQFIYELIERYRKEEYIANETVREIRHTASKNEWDMTPIILIALASLMVLRYFGRAIGEDGYQLIGGVALVFALFARQFFRLFGRKYV